MFCTKCGESALDAATFCSSCGEKLQSNQGGRDPSTGKLGDKDRVDYSAIVKAISTRDSEIDFGMVDDSADGGIRFGAIDGDVLIIAGPVSSGAPRNIVGISTQRVNADFTWLRFVGAMGDLPFETLLFSAKSSPCTNLGFSCQQFQQVGQLIASTPVQYCTPEFAAYLACTLLEDMHTYRLGEPFTKKARRIWNHIESTHSELEQIEQVRTWINDSEKSEIFIETTDSALLLSHRLSSLSLVTTVFPDGNTEGEEVEEFFERVYELSENMPFHDAGLGLTVDYRDFMLALQVVLPIGVASVDNVAKHVEFLELAARMVSGE